MMDLIVTLKKELIVFFVSMLPIIELKGAIPIGLSLGLSARTSIIFSVLGSCIPCPFILYGINRVLFQLESIRPLKLRILNMKSKVLRRGKYVNRIGRIGLFLFVAIPLPGTGVWSGSLLAVLLGFRPKNVLPYIIVSNIVAGFIIATVSYGVVSIL